MSEKTIFYPMEINIPYYEDNSRISNTATNIFKQGPNIYKSRIIDKEKTEDDPKAFRNGTMEHMYILQKDEFWKNYKILNYEKPKSELQLNFAKKMSTYLLERKYTSYDSNEEIYENDCKEAYMQTYNTKEKSESKIIEESFELYKKLESYITYLMLNDKKEPITFQELQNLKKTEDNIREHKLAKTLTYNNEYENSNEFYAMNEFHINWEYLGLQCKSLIDRLIIDISNKTIYLIDLKTTGDINNFNESFEKYNYAKQLAWYWKAIEYYLKNYSNIILDKTWIKKTYIIAIKNHNEKTIKVFPINDEIINSQYNEIEAILNEIKWHTVKNKWEHTREYYEGNGEESMIKKFTT